MNTTLSLFDWHPSEHHRTTDPATSRASAASAGQLAHNHARMILDALAGLETGTASAIAAKSGLDPVQVNRRMKDLHRAGLVELTGGTAVNQAGRMERVWKLA